MADRNDSDRIEAEDPAYVRRQLTKRMVLAATMIAVLLGALAVFDHLSHVEEAEEEYAEPVRVPQVGPSLRSEGKPEEAPPPPAAPAPEPPPQPEIPAQPSAVPPPAAPVPPPIKPPAGAVRPPAAKPAPAAPVSPPAVGVPEGTAAPAAPLPAPAPRPVVPRLGAGFLLQAGVFSNHERAEELKAQLLEAGIPASIESRVHVGPFASKKEAEAARAKMKLLGIDALLLPPRPAPAGGHR